MNICKVWDADYPWDIRVEKVIHSLTTAGHLVRLVCRNQGRRITHERNGSLSIHRLSSLPHFLGPANTVWNFPFPFNPVWIATIGRAIRENRANLVLVRDILLAPSAAMLARTHRIPVVLDMAENYPGMLEDRQKYTPTTLLGRAIRHPAFAKAIERLTIRTVHHIIVVVEESRDRLVRLGVPPGRISIVSNTPLLDRWSLQAGAGASPQPVARVKLVYLGNLDGSRGVDTAIRAVARLEATGHRAHLFVIGDGPSKAHLQHLTRTLNVADRVNILGRLPFSEVQAIMAASDIGLIPHYATDAWNATIPNKLFDYMLLGMPVVVSDAKPTARIVRTENCGEVYRAGDDTDLARCIVSLEDQDARCRMGSNGRNAVQRVYNWNNDSKVLLGVVEAAVSAVRN